MIVESQCEQDTFQIGRELGERAVRGDIFLLNGDLGVGKTVFTKGFAEGLNITEPITSPTFTLIQEYGEGRLPLYHMDMYRIGDAEEAYELGIEGYLYGDGVCLIEWASRIREVLPDRCREVTIEKDPERGYDYRKITIEVCNG